MITSPVLFAFLVCFVLCCLTFSQPVPHTSAQEWNQQIKDSDTLDYDIYLLTVLASASVGRNIFEQPDPLTSDCVRTVRVIVNSLFKPSTSKATIKIAELALKKALKDTATDRNPAQILCEKLNEGVKLSNDTLIDFEEQKNKVILPKPEKSYFLEIPKHKNFTQYIMPFFKEPLQTKIEIQDGELLRFATMMHFNSKPEFEAVLELAKDNALRPIVDALFTQALDDYVKANPKKEIYLGNIDRDITYEDFHKLVDEYFMKNEQLKEEYKKVVDEEKRNRQPGPKQTIGRFSDQKRHLR